MPEDNSKQIEERLAELPQDVQDAVLSSQLGEHVREIGQKHGLHIDQVGKLEDETMLVMLGFFDPTTFNTQLEEQLLIPATDAATIAAEISQQIFAPIRASLENFMRTKRTGTQAPVTSTPIMSAPTPATAVPPAVPMVEIAPTPVPIKIMLTPSVPSSTIPASVPITAPTPFSAPVQPQSMPVMPKPPISAVPNITMPNAEKMLTEKTSAIIPQQMNDAAKPIYKADPYREPIE